MTLPMFNDGIIHIYQIKETDDVQSSKHLEDTKMFLWFEELSISDRLRSQLNSSNVDIQMKIRIPQYKKLSSMSVVKIDEDYFKVYNAYHFTDKDGYQMTDVTLVNWDGDTYEER